MLVLRVYIKEGNKDEKGKLKSTTNVKVGFYQGFVSAVISY